MKTSTWKRIVLLGGLCCAVLFGLGHSVAQTVTGSITGQVTDASGAVIPNATVTAVNIATGVKSTTPTNGQGVYTLRFLPIGTYTVEIDAKGFTPQKFASFALEIDQTVKLNAALGIGAQESVSVSSENAAILNTTDATLGSVFTANTIANLPLNGLDFSALTLYLPGSVNTAGTSGTTSIERSISYTDTPNMNGNRAQANNYTLDGIDINENYNNVIGYSPAPEALGEVKVLTANSPADYGNVNGGGVVSVLKSGTNQYHGSFYGYEQNQKFNANSWQNNFSHQPKGPFSEAQFGATFGGPVRLPFLFDGRDKLFFFVDYLGARYHTGGAAPALSLLTPAMLKGDFSSLFTLPTPIQLYDPSNNYAPYVNNQVPVLNPVAKFLAANPQFYPAPNQMPSDGVDQKNFAGTQRKFQANNQGDVKLEYAPRAADRISAFWSISTGYDGTLSSLPITFPGSNLYPSKVFGTTWTHTFNPSLVNSARVGFTRISWTQGIPFDSTGYFGNNGDADIGIPFPGQKYPGFTNQNISQVTGIGNDANDTGIIDNTFSYIDNLTMQRGRHLLSMGLQGVRYQNNYPTGNNYGFLGTFNYTGEFTSNPNPNVTNAVGYGPADFVLDRVSNEQVTLGSAFVGQRQWRAAGFFQDDFKLSQKLTLNLGIRYEFDEPWIESNNKTGNIDLKTGQYIYAVSIPQGAPAGSAVCKNRGCYQPNYKQVTPRLGFAYQASSKLVVRGGYGASSFYEGNSFNQRLTAITPFIAAVNSPTNYPTPTSGGSFSMAENGFPAASAGGSISTYPQNIQPAYVQEWNLTTEYALTPKTSLQVGYIGEKGDHIEDYGNVNQPTNIADQTTAPYYNNVYLQAGNSSILITESRAMMNFNALEAVLRQRLSKGLEFTVNYTYGKAMTNSLGNYGLQVAGYSGAFQNYYDSKADYGPAGYDVRHNISATGVYALPFGHGRTYLSDSNRLLDAAIGGWKLSTALVSYTGFPETVTGPGNGSNNEGGNSRANQYRKLKIVHRSPINWFGTDPSATPCTTPGVDNGVCAFGPADSTHFGTSKNGAVRGPGYFNEDFSLFKDFRTYKEQAFTFRYDLFNAFNIVSYGNPDTGVTDSTFGQIVSQENIRSTERRMQFSASYHF
jgi:hypothetical protein